MKQSIQIYRTSPKYRISRWDLIKEWLIFAAKDEGKLIGNISITFMSDEELLVINRKQLKHNYYTDILTFNLSDNLKTIDADIYISYERTKENAMNYAVSQIQEIRRVLIHGLLHLMGYDDKTGPEKKIMGKRENYYLDKYNEMFHVKHLG